MYVLLIIMPDLLSYQVYFEISSTTIIVDNMRKVGFYYFTTILLIIRAFLRRKVSIRVYSGSKFFELLFF